MQTPTINNTAQFLLDGDEFFQQLHISIRNLLNAPTANDSYLRLAYWGFNRNIKLPGCTDGAGNVHAATAIRDLITQLATKGHIVQIIMWYGPPVVMTMDENWEAYNAFRLFNESGAQSGGALPNFRAIDLYMEIYKGKWAGYSTHQKIALATIGGVKQAFVGGFNIDPGYLSNDIHTVTEVLNPGGSRSYPNRWHDTGIKVGGPITDAIEAEWVRRWRKQDGNGPAPNTAFPNTPVIGGANIPITLLTTNAEADPIETDIRTAMIQRIGAAKNTIYLENYALTDPAIVDALAKRQIGTNPPTIIAVVNYPHADDPFSYLMYYTYANLALINFTTITYGALPNTLNRTDVKFSSIEISGLNPDTISTFKPVSSYNLKFMRTAGTQVEKIAFGDIKSITTPQTVMYAPQNKAVDQRYWTYPHSKLAIFDDRYTIIGSSNWTYRSMQYDGEIALEIDNQAFTTALRDRLFTHWRQPTDPTQWHTRATQNATDLATPGTVPDGEVRITPLAFGNFVNPTSPTWGGLGTTLKSTIAAMF